MAQSWREWIGLRYNKPDDMREILTYEEKVWEWLLRSYDELEDLLEDVKKAQEVEENKKLSEKDKEALVKSLVKKALKELRGAMGEERVERQLDRSLVKMEKVLHAIITHYNRLSDRSGTEKDVSHYIDQPQHYLRQEKSRGVDFGGRSHLPEFRDMREILKKIDVFKADLERLCSRAGEIEKDLRGEISPEFFEKALRDLGQAITDVQGFSELVKELRSKTQSLQTDFKQYKPVAEKEAGNDEEAMKAAFDMVTPFFDITRNAILTADSGRHHELWQKFVEFFHRGFIQHKQKCFADGKGRHQVMDAFAGRSSYGSGFPSLLPFWDHQLVLLLSSKLRKDKDADENIERGVAVVASKLALLTFGVSYFFANPTPLQYLVRGGPTGQEAPHMLDVIKSAIDESYKSKSVKSGETPPKIYLKKSALKKLCESAFANYEAKMKDIKSGKWHTGVNSLSPNNVKERKEFINKVLALF